MLASLQLTSESSWEMFPVQLRDLTPFENALEGASQLTNPRSEVAFGGQIWICY